MLHTIIASAGGERILELIEYVALGTEILAVMIIVVSIIHACSLYLQGYD